MIHEEICTCEVAKLAKEKGFNVPTDFCYEQSVCLVRCGSIAAPTQSLLQRWLREEKGIHIGIGTDGGNDWCYITVVITTGHTEYNTNIFPTYELALEDALKYTLEKLV